MSENRELLDRVLSRFAPDPDEGLARTLRRVRRRRRRRAIVAATLAIVVFGAAGVFLWSALRPAHSIAPPLSPPVTQSPSPTGPKPSPVRTRPQQPYPHHIAPGFVQDRVISGSVDKLVVQSPPGSIRWALDSATCTVSGERVPGGGAGNMGGGSFGGAGCAGNAYLGTNGQGGIGFRLGFFSVAAGRVIPVGGVQVRVILANGAQETVQPIKGLWMVVVQRCGNFWPTEPRTVEAISSTGKVLARVTLPKQPAAGLTC
jgi:hypothetical protein